jgi:hypothetical protein
LNAEAATTTRPGAVALRDLGRSHLLIPVAFFVCQALAVASGLNGPFLDEAVNVTAGLQILRGQPGQFGWLGGSVYLYPILAGAAYALGGLAGTRLMTAALYTLILWLFSRFTTAMLGRSAAGFATGLLAINGVFFSQAHLAVYDAVSMVGVCGAAWAAVEMFRTGKVSWTLAAGLFGALAITSKYPSAIALLSVSSLTLALARGLRTVALAMLSIVVAALVVVSYMLVAHGFVIPRVALTQALGEPELFDRTTLGYQAFYALALPFALAVLGAGHIWREHRLLALTLLSGGLLWGALHVALGRYASLVKDSAFGFLMLYPLAGMALSKLWRERRQAGLALLGLAGLWGLAQCYWQDRSWEDIRPVVHFILPRLRSDQRIALEHGWSFSMYAVLDHHLPADSSVIDRYRYEHGEDVCDADWIVGTRRSASDTSDPLVRAAQSCRFDLAGTFPYDFYSPIPPLVQHLRWEFVVFRRSSSSI